MTDLPPLESLNWDSDTCSCRVEPRRYYIGREPARLLRDSNGFRMAEERIWCHLHHLDGSVEDIPMRVTTIEEMLASGLNHEYWQDARRRQLQQIAHIEGLMAQPGSPPAWRGILERVRRGKTYADRDGIRRSPGTQTRGHLTHRCPRHHNQTSTSLMSQLCHKSCGCVIRQITVGERREGGINHEQYVEICPLHREGLLVA